MRPNLRSVPFFSDLPEEVLAAIEKRGRHEHYKKGDLIFAEGDYGDRMYLIESGQVKVTSEAEGQEVIFSYLNPGNFFGETALLTGEPRNANVRVVIDSDLVALTKPDLEELIEQYPLIAVQVSRELGRRITRSQRTPFQKEEYNLVTVTGPNVVALAQQLAALTGEDVFVLDLGGLAHTHLDQTALARARVFVARASDLASTELPVRLSALVQEYYWILMAVPPQLTPLTGKAIELADVTLQIGAAADADFAQLAQPNYWHIRDTAKMIARAARRIAQRQVGVALSSGSARGLAHIGVLQVFEQEKIPVDMIAATSMGSIIGALYCSGHALPEMLQIAAMMQKQTNFLTGFAMWDFGVPPRSGLLRGNKMENYFRRLLDNCNFEDLETPLNIVAADVISGEEVVFDRGAVAPAVRSSVSIIGVFEPAHVGDRFLVDGGAVNPVPTSVLADKGMNIIAASSVIPSLRDRIQRKQQQQSGRAPNVVTILMGAMEIMESEIIKTRQRPMDILIQPDVARFSTLDYARVHEIVAAGQVAAHLQASKIRQLLTPRPRPRPTG